MDGLEYFQVSLILFELRKRLHKTAREKPKRRFFRRLGMGARSFGAIGLLISQGKGFIQRDKNCILSQHTGLKHFNIHSISRCFGCQT